MATLTIANGQTTSDALRLDEKALIAILIPDTFTGTAITLLGSCGGSTFKAVYDAAVAALSLTVAAAHWVALTEAQSRATKAFTHLKLVSGSSEAGDRSIIAVTKTI
jgi:hypothetical protein